MGKSYNVVALISGGKDSCYSMLQCMAAGHKIVALANLKPKDREQNELDSYMFQTVGHQAIELYSEAMKLPLFCGNINGSSLNVGSNYIPTKEDEVEDLYQLLHNIKQTIDFDAICSGAILSDYQRVRVENVCQRLDLVSLAYLWRRDQAELLDEMIESKMDSIIIKVASLGLDQKHLGSSLAEMRNHLHKMNSKYGLNVCGEGGEYETFTLDCPLFQRKLEIEDSETIIHSNDAFAPVAFLKFKKLITKSKSDFQKTEHTWKGPKDFVLFEEEMDEPQENEEKGKDHVDENQKTYYKKSLLEPKLHRSRNWFYIYTISSKLANPKDATNEVFEKINRLLLKNELSLKDLVAVSLLVKNMNDFSIINQAYVKNFGINPPIRVCVEAPLCNDDDAKIAISAIGYVDEKNISTMHVQSISHWAPANIGPYSQAKLVDGILYVAGQIGLIPGSMELPDSVEIQAKLSMRHLKRILQVYNIDTNHIAQLVCYISSAKYFEIVEKIWLEEIKDSGLDYHQQILNCVVMPKLPKNAKVEWQAVATVEVPNIEVQEDENSKRIKYDVSQMTFFMKKFKTWCQQIDPNAENDVNFVYYSVNSPDVMTLEGNNIDWIPVEQIPDPDVLYFSNSRKSKVTDNFHDY